RINYAFRAGMIISFPCAAGLYILAFQICDLLYGMPEAGIPLEPMAFSCIALAAFQLSSAGLQGIGRPEIAMRHLIITGILKVIFNYTLTSVPMLNIKGAAIGTVIAFTIGSLLNIIYLQRLTGVKYETGRALKIAIVTVLMAIAVKISYGAIVGMDISSHIATAGAILIGVAVYGILLFITKELDLNMLKMIRS
ncbi:MAG: polysaccharide biosynthesis protein, partial [Syntrophomonadaceae bacterium]|nr:polysaccharide biosynthesis protein [Syntrophomonadaceae bacterium]